MKVSEALSGEIVLEKLIDTLVRTAIEHAGAERGVLILARGDEYRIEAEATVRSDKVQVEICDGRASPRKICQALSSATHCVPRRACCFMTPPARTRSRRTPTFASIARDRYSACPYSSRARLLGMLYLENNLTIGAFTPARMAVLKLLASEAAISMENARLYRDLAERESRIRRLVDANIIGIFFWDLKGRILAGEQRLSSHAGIRRARISRQGGSAGRI